MNPIEWKELKIYAGTSINYTLYFKEDGSSKDITGWTVYFIVKSELEDADASAKINKKIRTHTDPTLGKTIIELSATDTALVTLPAGSYQYEISYKDTDGNQKVILRGRLQVEKAVIDTRA